MALSLLHRSGLLLSSRTIITAVAALSFTPRLIAENSGFCTSSARCSDEVEKAKIAAQTAEKTPTIFDKILSKEIPADIVYEDDKAIAFRDVNPVAPTHLLIIPRKRIAQVNDMTEEDIPLVGHLIYVAKKVAEQEGLSQDGYRLVINNGINAAQSVYHLHVHLMGGRKMAWPPG